METTKEEPKNKYSKEQPYGSDIEIRKPEAVTKQEVYTDLEHKNIDVGPFIPVGIKKLNDKAVIPTYAKPGDAGMDLTATSKTDDGDIITYGTSLAFEIPEGYVGLLFNRSSVYKQDLNLTNAVGVLDSGFRGEVMFKFRKTRQMGKEYNIGDRVGQVIVLPYPQVRLIEKTELSETERGTGGHGSTGK